MFDLFITETNDGGDLQLIGNDLKVIYGLENMPYLGLFGGNPGNPTRDFIATEQRFDWWGNQRFFQDQPSVQMNSETEFELSNNPISSAGRLRFEQTIKSDLSFMGGFAEIETELTQPQPDRLNITIFVREKTSQQSSEFTYLWDAAEGNLIQQ